jgi:hypothetical protein
MLCALAIEHVLRRFLPFDRDFAMFRKLVQSAFVPIGFHPVFWMPCFTADKRAPPLQNLHWRLGATAKIDIETSLGAYRSRGRSHCCMHFAIRCQSMIIRRRQRQRRRHIAVVAVVGLAGRPRCFRHAHHQAQDAVRRRIVASRNGKI